MFIDISLCPHIINSLLQANDNRNSLEPQIIEQINIVRRSSKLRAEVLRETDPFNEIYVGEVGKWMPWEPDYYKTGEVEYLEPELNTLMQEKNKQDKLAKNKFEERIKDAKKKAIEDNIQKAEESGNVLTQNIDDEGNLVSIGGDNITSNDLRKELFEGDNIRTKEFDKNNTDPMLDKIGKK